MRRLLLPFALLAACSSDPAPPLDASADTGPADTGTDAPRDHGGDDLPVPVDVVDAGDVDTGPDAQLEDVPAVDVEDLDAAAADVVDVHLVDAADDASTDASHDAAVDVLLVDAVDASADTSLDVPRDEGHELGVDAGEDAGGDVGTDVVDVPRDEGVDTGPVDAGPTRYDLDAARSIFEVHSAFMRLNFSGTRTVCDGPSNATCSVSGGFVTFNLYGCFSGNYLTGRIAVGSGIRAGALDFNGNYLPTLRITSGTERSHRQSFLVQFAGPLDGSRDGAEGLPGRTVDPALGDLWLLGCPVE